MKHAAESGSRTLSAALERYQSPGVTPVGDEDAIFLASAHEARVVDVDGTSYLDFCAGFGVAGTGHSNHAVVRAIGNQAAVLMHAMGDLHPAEIQAPLLEKLAAIAPGALSKSYLCSTGSEAVEAALKTALLYNGRPGIIAFNGAYHGLSLGALGVCGLPFFRKPFASALTQRSVFVDYPRQRQGAAAIERAITAIEDAVRKRADIGAVIVEPIQGRAGIVLPPDGFLSALRAFCDRQQLVLIADEVYTGFGRTGKWFAVEHEDIVPDLLCVGKALANGFPMAATIGTPKVMDAWPAPEREALHTSTFMGNPMGCAAALATIEEIERLNLPARATTLSNIVAERLEPFRRHEQVTDIRGRGLFWGIEMRTDSIADSIVRAAVRQGLMIFAEGAVVAIMPPLTITESELAEGLNVIGSLFESVPA